MSGKIYTVEDARLKAKRRLPKMVFDYIDGAAGRELLAEENITAYQKIKLQPRALINVENRTLNKTFLGKDYGLPFGIAPMGMWLQALLNRLANAPATMHGFSFMSVAAKTPP